MSRLTVLGLLVFVPACTGPTLPEPPPNRHKVAVPSDPCAPGSVEGDESCMTAGLPVDLLCAPGEVVSEGSCVPAGVVTCATGFVFADGTCQPIMPSDACGDRIATLGDSACLQIADCGTGTYGNIAVEANTQRVDPTFVPGPIGSDGSELRPWTTIADAIAAADDGAIVALAAGSYVGPFVVDKRVRLRGVCPEQVELAAAGEVVVTISAAAAELSGVTVRDGATGVHVTADSAVVDSVHIHDMTDHGVLVENARTALVNNALVERGGTSGVMSDGGSVMVTDSELRNNAFGLVSSDGEVFAAGVIANGNTENGIVVQRGELEVNGSYMTGGSRGGLFATSGEEGIPTSLQLHGSIIDGVADGGVLLYGSEAQITGTVIRNVTSAELTRGAGVEISAIGERSSFAIIDSSLIHDVRNNGIVVGSSTLTFNRSAIRNTIAAEEDGTGVGIIAAVHPEALSPSLVSMEQSSVEMVQQVGLHVAGSEAIVVESAFRDIAGRAINEQPDAESVSSLSVTSSTVATSELGIVSFAQALIASSEITGSGIVSVGEDDMVPALMDISATRVDGARDVGVFAVNSELKLFESFVGHVGDEDSEQFGDGLSFILSDAEVHRILVSDSARASMSVFGSTVRLSESDLLCGAIDINGESFDDHGYFVEDGDDNQCGCPEPGARCLAVSSGLTAPEAVGSLE